MVETRDHVNLMYFFAFLYGIQCMFLDFSFEIRSVARYLYFLWRGKIQDIIILVTDYFCL